MIDVRYTFGGNYDPDNSDVPYLLSDFSNFYATDQAGSLKVQPNGKYAVVQGNRGLSLHTQDNSADLTPHNAGYFCDFSQQTASIEIVGGDFNDVIRSGSAVDTLTGGGGDDVLEGGAGGDHYDGGAGSNTVSFEHSTSRVACFIEYAPDNGKVIAGTDAVDDTYTNIQNVRGSAFDDILSGDEFDNVIEGGAGRDKMDGGLYGGNDTASYEHAATGVVASFADRFQNTGDAFGDIYTTIENLLGSAFADTLTGDGGANILTGAGGNDTLDGAGGTDTMKGGAGDDRYYVDDNGEPGGDTIVEAAGQGSDTVLASGSYTLTFLDNVENLTLLGSGNLEGRGNALVNVLTGNTGQDTLIGGDGNDTYVVQVGNTTIVERAGAVAGKVDAVLASVSFTLDDNIERLTLTGTGAIDGTGNGLLNLITGNTKANVLDGGLGNDILKGGSGLDTFVFSTALGPSNIDRITDFAVGREKIHLDQDVFSALSVGALDPTQFKDISNGAKYDADDRIVYRADKGALYYDADGYGGTAKAVAFAVLDTHPTNLTASDILVV